MEDTGTPKVFYPGEHFWKEESDGLHLVGSHCKSCGQNYFPSRDLCPECYINGAEGELEPIQLGSSGKLYSYSIVRVAPKMFQVPYGVGYIDFPEGVRVFGQLTTADPGELQVGMEMKLELGRVSVNQQGQEVYSYKFRPVR